MLFVPFVVIVMEFFVDKIYVYDGYIVITCYMKDHGYIEDYGAILEAIKSDNKKGKKKGGKGVRQGCGQARQTGLELKDLIIAI